MRHRFGQITACFDVLDEASIDEFEQVTDVRGRELGERLPPAIMLANPVLLPTQCEEHGSLVVSVTMRPAVRTLYQVPQFIGDRGPLLAGPVVRDADLERMQFRNRRLLLRRKGGLCDSQHPVGRVRGAEAKGFLFGRHSRQRRGDVENGGSALGAESREAPVADRRREGPEGIFRETVGDVHADVVRRVDELLVLVQRAATAPTEFLHADLERVKLSAVLDERVDRLLLVIVQVLVFVEQDEEQLSPKIRQGSERPHQFVERLTLERQRRRRPIGDVVERGLEADPRIDERVAQTRDRAALGKMEAEGDPLAHRLRQRHRPPACGAEPFQKSEDQVAQDDVHVVAEQLGPSSSATSGPRNAVTRLVLIRW